MSFYNLNFIVTEQRANTTQEFHSGGSGFNPWNRKYDYGFFGGFTVVTEANIGLEFYSQLP